MDWTVEPAHAGTQLGRFLRERIAETSWNGIKRLIATGKVFVDGACETLPVRPLRPGERIEVRMAAPRVKPGQQGPRAAAALRVVYEDAHVVVVDKPSGLSSVPYEKGETGTALDLLREILRKRGAGTRPPLFVVHRIDKETSGLLAFARTKHAERGLAQQLRAHTVERTYLCVAQGDVPELRIESQLVPDRGDGLRGSTQRPNEGKRAVTLVEPVRRLGGATECRVRLLTGKTHQIRIHLAEQGHPLVGEKVYIRDLVNAGQTPIPAARLLLHAATLGFEHPVTHAEVRLASDPPESYTLSATALRGSDPA